MKRNLIKGSALLLMVLVVYLIPRHMINQKIAAKSDWEGGPPLVIDANSPTPYELPFDARRLVEPELKAQSSWTGPFYNYVQDESKVMEAQIGGKLVGLGGNADTSIRFVLQQLDYNYIVGIENRAGSIVETVIYKVDPTGKILNYINLGSGKKEGFSVDDAQTIVNYTQASQAYATVYGNGSMSIGYVGFLPSNNGSNSTQEECGTSRILNLDPNLLIVDEHTLTEVSPAVVSEISEFPDRYGIETLFSGYQTFSSEEIDTPNEPMTGSIFKLDRYRYQKMAELNLPKFTDYSAKPASGEAKKLIKEVYKVFNGYIGKVVFSTNFMGTLVEPVEVIVFWDDNGTILEQVQSTDKLLPNLSNSSKFYFQRTVGSDVVVEGWEANTPLSQKFEAFKTKVGNNFSFIRNKDYRLKTEFDFYGSYTVDSPEMEGFHLNKGIVTGSLDQNMKVKSVGSVEVDSAIQSVEIHRNADSNEKFFITGLVTPESSFVEPHTGQWTAKRPAWKDAPYAYVGGGNKIEDYAPAMHNTMYQDINTVIVDIDKLKKEPSLIDTMLFTDYQGKRFPAVYDTKDTNTPLIEGISGKIWLENRINKNPNNPALPIDWIGLGYDGGDNYGPKRVTYFVTDSQKQTTSITQIVNNVSSETVWKTNADKEDLGIGASNFMIHVNELPTKLKDSFDVRKLSNTLGWSFRSGNVNDQWDSDSDRGMLVIDQDELKTIQEAKVKYDELEDGEDASEIIKPYPLTIRYDPDRTYWPAADLGGPERTIMVFVTDDQTVVDTKEKVVLYASNTKMHLKEAQEKSSLDMVKQMKVSAWNYKMKSTDKAYPSSEIDANITDPIPDNPAEKNKTGINNVDEAGDYFVKFIYKNTTNQLAIAKVINDPVKLHIRQVLLNSTTQLAIPQRGYVQLASQKLDPLLGQGGKIHVETSSKEEASPVDYKEVGLLLESPYFGYQLNPIIPEYYQYDGVVITDKEVPHNSQERRKNPSLYLDYHLIEEYWVTIYITPALKGKEPQFYNWDYQNRLIN